MVFEPAVFDWIDGDQTSLEAHTLEDLARAGQLTGYRHADFWQCMDTLRDLRHLRDLWSNGESPWKTWREAA